MSTDSSFQRVAVLGVGLIGGSFALATRQFGARVVGFDRPEALEKAAQMGAIDEPASDVASAVRGADLVFVALPVGAALDALPVVARHAQRSALVSDACSTKVRVCEAAAKAFAAGTHARFLGGHPLAGSESGGIENADAGLFRDAKWALVAREQDEDAWVQQFAALVRALGAEPLWMDAETHDWAAAIVSHLPQLAAVALAGVVKDETDETGLPLTLAGPGLRDALRLAGSPYDVSRDICPSNPHNLRLALDRLITALDHLRNNLTTRELEGEFAGANEVYKILRGMK